jgi:four helix bundle protein
MTSEEMKNRTKRFAIAIVRFAQTLPKDSITAIMTRQLVKSGTSVGANYRSSCRSKSAADFISKMTIAEEEGDEALFWLELLVEAEIVRSAEVAWLVDEADQLVRIIVASIKTKRANMANQKSNLKSEIRDPKSQRRAQSHVAAR